MLDRVTRLPGAPYLLTRGTLLRGLSFCHVNGSCRFTRLAEVRRPQKIAAEYYIPRQLLTLTTSGDYAQLVECKTIALDTEKRSLGERAIKNLNLPPKRFFCSPSCFLCLAVSRGTLPPCKQGLTVRALQETRRDVIYMRRSGFVLHMPGCGLCQTRTG